VVEESHANKRDCFAAQRFPIKTPYQGKPSAAPMPMTTIRNRLIRLSAFFTAIPDIAVHVRFKDFADFTKLLALRAPVGLDPTSLAAPRLKGENLLNISEPLLDPKLSPPIFSTRLKYKGFPTRKPYRATFGHGIFHLNFRCYQRFSRCWTKI
jgi:hypothetical protein